MISHLTLGSSDFGKALRFYEPVMAGLGWKLRFRDDVRPWAVWAGPDGGRPFLILMTPFDGGLATAGNGSMTALLTKDRPSVDRIHALALSLGGFDEGPPGLRPEYHPGFYGAYVRDPDGNKLCFCTHGAS